MSVKLRKQKSGNNTHSLYLDIHIKGMKRQRSALGLKLYDRPKTALEKLHNEQTKATAETKRSNTQLELQAGANGVEYINPEKISFPGFFQQYIDSYKKKDKSKFTSALTHFNTFNGTKPLKLSQDFVDDLKHYLLYGAGLKGETPSTYCKKIKKICLLAYDKRIIKTDPAKLKWTIKFDKHHLRKEVLTEEEFLKLASTAFTNDLTCRVYLFINNTGLRPGDCEKLKVKDIRNWKLAIQQGKTKNYVYVDLNQNAKMLVGKLGKDEDYVFPGLPSETTTTKHLKDWCEAAGIKKHITMYCARHTFCTFLMKNKVDTKTIISLMGWDEETGLENLMRYAHFFDESAKAAVEGLPVIKLK